MSSRSGPNIKKVFFCIKMYATIDQLYKEPIQMHVGSALVGNSHDPDLFGPSFWFTLHNGATTYPVEANPTIQAMMKGFIIGLPIMVPCTACKEHAFRYINKANLDEITRSKENLFRFFVDFHNMVNTRYNRPVMTVDEAKKFYGYDGGSRIQISFR
jgi:hypothetical protein